MTLEVLRKQANEEFDGDLIRAGTGQKKLDNLCGIIEHTAMFKDTPVVALEKVLSMTRYRDYVKEKYKKEGNKVHTKLENLERFSTLVIMLAQNGKFTLDDLIFQLALDRVKEDEGEERAAVTEAYKEGVITEAERDVKLKTIEQGSVVISTIHGAKGSEYRRVYIASVTEGSLPHFFCKNPEEVAEERRVFFVACTRAKDQLVICVPQKQLSRDGKKLLPLRPSRFLTELGI